MCRVLTPAALCYTQLVYQDILRLAAHLFQSLSYTPSVEYTYFNASHKFNPKFYLFSHSTILQFISIHRLWRSYPGRSILVVFAISVVFLFAKPDTPALLTRSDQWLCSFWTIIQPFYLHCCCLFCNGCSGSFRTCGYSSAVPSAGMFMCYFFPCRSFNLHHGTDC